MLKIAHGAIIKDVAVGKLRRHAVCITYDKGALYNSVSTISLRMCIIENNFHWTVASWKISEQTLRLMIRKTEDSSRNNICMVKNEQWNVMYMFISTLHTKLFLRQKHRAPYLQWNTEMGISWYGCAFLQFVLWRYMSLKDTWIESRTWTY